MKHNDERLSYIYCLRYTEKKLYFVSSKVFTPHVAEV